jgi:hypothetical protein
MRSKDPTAYVPVIVFLMVPAGPLRSQHRWARRFHWRQVEVEGVGPHRRWRRWKLNRLWMKQVLETMQARRGVLGPPQDGDEVLI